MTPPVLWHDGILIAAALVWLAGFVAGLWVGFKLWRQSYVQLSDRGPRVLRLFRP